MSLKSKSILFKDLESLLLKGTDTILLKRETTANSYHLKK